MIARWTAIDPHAEKYNFISPYVYVANNPLIFIDKDGRDITIPLYQDDGGFAQKTFNQLQSLTSQTLVLLNTGQVVPMSINVNLDNIVSVGKVSNIAVLKTFGTGLVDDIINNHDYNVKISDNGGGIEGVDAVDGSKGSAQIWHDADRGGKGVRNADGTQNVGNQVALGHDLIHVRHHMKGIAKNGSQNVIDPDDNRKRELSKEEIATSKEENKLRKEQLEKDRAQPVIVQ